MREKIFIFIAVLAITSFSSAQLPLGTTMEDFFLPGSQPNESGDLSGPATCGCHDNVSKGADIYYDWEGSMMRNAMRDLLFLATMEIATQDADSSADLCTRCHTPTGWLSGRSEPPDNPDLIGEDYSSVNCLFCHRALMPADPPQSNPYPLDATYTADTRDADSTYLSTISDHIPPTTANGMFVVDTDDRRRGPYDDASPPHGKFYSPFHIESDICGTCHDVSNPVFVRDGTTRDYAADLPFGSPAPSFDPYTQFPVERTYSEWLMSAYNTSGGISGTNFGGNKSTVSTCQDCHMEDETGVAVNNGTVRTDLGMHDLTGGNTFMPGYFKANFSGEFSDPASLDSGVARATRMLKLAATVEVQAINDVVTVTVTNETGHKLPSGYPEGRRIWLNVRAFDDTQTLIFESGAYNLSTGVLTKDSQVKIYEIKPGLSTDMASIAGLATGPSFHFVLNDTIYSDNRIPPRGFTNANFESIQSPPAGYSYPDNQYWDVTNFLLPQMPDSVAVTLYYQTTSKEYIEFLESENTNTAPNLGDDIYAYWNDNGKSAPVAIALVTLGSGDISLPVELSSFSANYSEGKVTINWQTNSEIENAGFILLRAKETDAVYYELSSYETNPDLVGLGTSSSGKEYSYIDEAMLEEGMTYFYKLQDVSYSGLITTHGPISVVITDIDGGNVNLPYKFDLQQNYPNPFNPGTTIPFTVDKKELVGFNIYDVNGRLVRRFSKKLFYAGKNEIYWDGKDTFGRSVASGIYYYKIYTLDKQKMKKMILLK